MGDRRPLVRGPKRPEAPPEPTVSPAVAAIIENLPPPAPSAPMPEQVVPSPPTPARPGDIDPRKMLESASPTPRPKAPPASLSRPGEKGEYADILTQCLNFRQAAAGQSYFLVALPDNGWPALERYESVDLLVAAIKKRLGSSCYLFPFMGSHLAITSGPHRFMRTPVGELPLFDLPKVAAQIDAASGWVGEGPLEEDVCGPQGEPPSPEVSQPTQEPETTPETDLETPVFPS